MEIKSPDALERLAHFEAELRPKLALREVQITGGDFSGSDSPNVTAELCLFEKVLLVGAHLAGLQLWNVRVERGDWSGVQAEEGQLDRVEFRNVRMRGFVAGAGNLKNVVFEECQLDSANFRFSNLSSVRFDNCSMKSADFGSASLDQVRFLGCDLDGASFARATMKDVDLRSSSIAALGSADGLAGATISTLQLLDLAPLIAANVGIRVSDD